MIQYVIMKYSVQLKTLALAVLLFASYTSANPVADLAAREPEAEAAPVLVGDAGLSAPIQLEKRKKIKGGSSNSNSTSDALALTPGGALGIAGLAVFALMT